MIFNFLLAIIVFFIFLYLFNKFWNLYLEKSYFYTGYDSIQRAHLKEVPRFGGLLAFIFIFSYFLFNGISSDNFIFYILLSSFPLVVVSSLEDIFHSVRPIYRFITMIFSIASFFMLFTLNLPVPEIPFFDVFNNNVFLVFFYFFSILVVINGNNLIDGMNGLLIINLISQLISLLFFSYIANDYVFLSIH